MTFYEMIDVIRDKDSLTIDFNAVINELEEAWSLYTEKEPVHDFGGDWYCPCCGENLLVEEFDTINNCYNCGQSIDWSSKDD